MRSDIDQTLGTLKSVTEPKGQKVNYTYDQLKRVTAVSAAAGGKNYKNTYAYKDDRLQEAAHNTTGDGCDVKYTFGYDAAGRPTTVKVGTQTLSTNAYNADGTLKSVTYGNGVKANYGYDAFKRVTSLKYDGDSRTQCRYAYGANGQVACEYDDVLGRQTYYEYDFANRPARYTVMQGNTNLCAQELTYDEFGNPLELVEQIGANRDEYKTAWKYDVQNRPKRVYYKSEVHRVQVWRR